MKRRDRSNDIFSVSFLDIISCGFGAVVLLVLISNKAEAPSGPDDQVAKDLLNQVLEMEEDLDALARVVAELESEKKAQGAIMAAIERGGEEIEAALQSGQQDLDQLADDMRGLSLVQESLSRATIQPATADERDDEVGGIPVDSDYAVFIVDTSASMFQIWPRVTAEISNIMDIHPTLQGFQILNDNGAHLISSYAGRWIPDNPSRRKAALALMSSWRSTSNSSPVEGLEQALRSYVDGENKTSIYIFGDDYSGGSYDPVFETLDRLNIDPVTNKPKARVHGVGFRTRYTRDTFATLMREIARRHNGTFVTVAL